MQNRLCHRFGSKAQRRVCFINSCTGNHVPNVVDMYDINRQWARRFQIPWCSGYHVSLTHSRSRVQSSAESHRLLRGTQVLGISNQRLHASSCTLPFYLYATYHARYLLFTASLVLIYICEDLMHASCLCSPASPTLIYS